MLLSNEVTPGAEKIYRSILKQHPKHFQSLSNLRSVLLLSERVEGAIQCLRGALNQKPNSAVVQTLLARALAMVDRHDDALERVRRAFHATKRPVRTASHAQVRQSIYRGSVGRPRPPHDLLLPLLAALGVERDALVVD